MRGFILGSLAAALALILSATSPGVTAVGIDEPEPESTGARADRLHPQQAAAVFERFKGLAGRWRARSSAGWEDEVTYEVAARGSVVVGRTSFADAPDRTMYTMVYPDGDQLLLTHFCEARNQPRLRASTVAEDGSVTFTFLDATNLPSRDHGHMDQAVYRFLDESRFSSRWTWYQEGSEAWLEEIVYTRLPDTTR